MTARDALVQVRELRVELDDGVPIVENVSLAVGPGEVVGLVGESGSGKTTTALALLGYARPGCRVAGGTVEVGGRHLSDELEGAARRLRGRVISYVPQDPSSALNPSLRVADVIGDMMRAHGGGGGEDAVLRALGRVSLPPERAFARRYPHQLSGGQQQRLTIATALVCEPPVVVMDEPTTGLDVVTQAQILEEVDRLRREVGIGIVYVSHNLAVVATIADRIAVMYAGRIVEEGEATEILTRPRHPYTRGLVASIPSHIEPRTLHGIPGVPAGLGERPAGCSFAPRCELRTAHCEEEVPPIEAIGPGSRAVRCFEWRRTPPLPEFRRREATPPADAGTLLLVESLSALYHGQGEAVVAASDVSFGVGAGECVALIGESGSGKTTIARCIAGLHPPESGRLMLGGELLAALAQRRTRVQRQRIQIVFQNPYDSLNPRHRIGDTIGRPARVLRGIGRAEAARLVDDLLARVRLPLRVAQCFPRELSGGERQRVALARALAAGPDLLVCDEITSALDVSVQAAVLELLSELRTDLGVSLLVITHDLGVVASVAERVIVLERGRICEEAPVESLLTSPEHEYTRRLIEAAPELPDPVADGES